MKSKTFTILIVSIALLLSSCSSNIVGKTYQNLRQIKNDLKDYVLFGSFGNKWHGKVIAVKEGENEITFSLATGAVHSYPAKYYHGFKFKVVFLDTGEGNETVLVFRKEMKSSDDKPRQTTKDIPDR